MLNEFYDYIAKNMNGFCGDFTVTVTDVSEKEPDMLLATIHPADHVCTTP